MPSRNVVWVTGDIRLRLPRALLRDNKAGQYTEGVVVVVVGSGRRLGLDLPG